MPVTVSQSPDLSTRSGIDRRALRACQEETTRPRWSFRIGKAVDGLDVGQDRTVYAR